MAVERWHHPHLDRFHGSACFYYAIWSAMGLEFFWKKEGRIMAQRRCVCIEDVLLSLVAVPTKHRNNCNNCGNSAMQNKKNPTDRGDGGGRGGEEVEWLKISYKLNILKILSTRSVSVKPTYLLSQQGVLCCPFHSTDIAVCRSNGSLILFLPWLWYQCQEHNPWEMLAGMNSCLFPL